MYKGGAARTNLTVCVTVTFFPTALPHRWSIDLCAVKYRHPWIVHGFAKKDLWIKPQIIRERGAILLRIWISSKGGPTSSEVGPLLLRSLTTFADKTQMLHGRLHGNSQLSATDFLGFRWIRVHYLWCELQLGMHPLRSPYTDNKLPHFLLMPFNLLLIVSHFSGFCKQVYLATARGKISRIDTKFIWFERALPV